MKFIHTADWQIGKPFAGISDIHKRSLVQKARIEVIKRIGLVAKDTAADFVLVAGDLFDSPSAGPLGSVTVGHLAASPAEMGKRFDEYFEELTKGKELGRARIFLEKVEHYHE